MNYLSLFSGIEACSVAWHPLGWRCVAVAEIEPFPCRTLHERFNASRPKYMPDPDAVEYPAGWDRKKALALKANLKAAGIRKPTPDQVAVLSALATQTSRRNAIRAVADLPEYGTPGTLPNLGDVSQVTDEDIRALGAIDVVVGGSPCQDLSVAGKRAGLVGVRSSLFHQQMRIFNAARTFCGARGLVWENVPGAFSSNRGRDFAVVVGAMAGLELAVPRDGWGSEGMALGENGLAEWGVLDAQWFGLAQRRARVFVVLDIGDWARRPPILLEPDGLRGDSAPRRETREGAAAIASQGIGSGVDFQNAALTGDIFGTLDSEGQARSNRGHGTLSEAGGGLPPISMCLNAGAMGRQDAESDTLIPIGGCFDVAPTILSGSRDGGCSSDDIPLTAHTLRGDGFDASEDGTGRGTPLVPVIPIAESGKRAGFTGPKVGAGIGTEGDPMFTLGTDSRHAIAFDTTQITSAANYSNPKPGDPCHPLAAGAHAPAVVYSFKPGQSEAAGATFVTEDFAPTLQAQNNGSTAVPAIAFSCKDHAADAADAADELAPCLRAMGSTDGRPNAGGQVAVAFHPTQDPINSEEVCHALAANTNATAAVCTGFIPKAPPNSRSVGEAAEQSPTVTTYMNGQGVQQAMAVRRLTPRECERLQGFPDDWTLIPWKGKPAEECPDGPRYKALGNSMATPVMRWIGQQIQKAFTA